MATDNCCICFPTSITSSNPCSPKSKCGGTCLYIPDLLIGSANSVGPCNENGFIPFTKNDTTICGTNPITFKVYSSTSNIQVTSITEEGIYFTSKSLLDSDDMVAKITFTTSCDEYATFTNVVVIYKNLCVGVPCGAGYICEKCTGDCIEAVSDITQDTIDPSSEGNGSGLIV